MNSLIFLVALLLTHSSQASIAQSSSPVQRDPQAVTVLNQVVIAAGGHSALASVQDITGSGTINYYFAASPVQGTATLKGRGLTEFRLDSTMPDGVYSSVISNGNWSRKNADGTTVLTPYRDPSNFENVLYPLAYVLNALGDSSISVSYIALESRNGIQVHHIMMAKPVAPSTAPGIAKNAWALDMFINSTTNQLASVLTVAFSTDVPGQTRPREIQYSNYQTNNGVAVPFAITEFFDGQCTLTIELSQVSFNNGLIDADFQL